MPVQVQCTMLDAWDWCTGTTQRDGMGREEGGGFRMDFLLKINKKNNKKLKKFKKKKREGAYFQRKTSSRIFCGSIIHKSPNLETTRKGQINIHQH